MALLKTFCCCCSLATGAKIVGWINLVRDIICLAIFIIALILVQNCDDPGAKCNFEMNGQKITESEVKTVLEYFIGVISILTIPSIFLLIGAAKERQVLLLPWIILSSLSLFAIFVFSILKGPKEILILPILGFVWQLYSLLVVISFFQELKEKQNALPDGENQNLLPYES